MEIVPMGTTHLPLETILEYLESLKQVYTPESYDLFAHNCNNFTNDFAMFLVGKGIPSHITSLPKRVLDTPFGQMLKPQLEAGMRSVTQAPIPARNIPSARSETKTAIAKPADSNGIPLVKSAPYGKVMNVSNLASLETNMSSASQTATTIFFTSSTCAPCKIAYPTFDSLSERYPHALFLKVDLNIAQDIGSKYQIRATPTFWTFSKGTKYDEWTGADPRALQTNVEQLIRPTFPPHPHTQLQVPTLQHGSPTPVTYTKVPPLDKLMAKLGFMVTNTSILGLKTFIQDRSVNPREAPLPNLTAISDTFRTKVLALPLEVRFAAVDLLRCGIADPRVSGFFAEERSDAQAVPALLKHVNDLGEQCPHNLRLVTLQLACNLSTSPLYAHEILKVGSELAIQLVQLVTASLLDASHPTTRVASSWLAYNLAVSNYRLRREEDREALAEELQVELAASLIESLGSEENSEAAKAQLLSLGYLTYCAPQSGEVLDLVKALDAKRTASAVGKGNEALAREVGNLL